MRTLAVLATLVLASATLGNIIELPMDTLDYISVQAGMDMAVVTEGDRTFVRTWNLSESTDWPGSPWYYAPIVNFRDANGGVDVDASAPGATLEFDVRYYQEGVGTDGSEPYQNCNFGVQLSAFLGPEWWRYANVWLPGAFNNPEPHGEWHHIVIPLDVTAENPEFDRTQFNRFEIHGSNARHVPEDHIDLDNVVITPEPSALALLGLGLVTVLRRR
jgi:hypothetical protein